jgi:rhodanese-related sulfurtransferase
MNHALLQLDPLAALQALQAGGCWLVDVREPHEVARAAYDHARVIALPLSELERRHAELPRDADLIMACAAGGRSMQAMQYLLHHGHTRVRNLTGGMGAWRAHGLPVR